MEQHKDDRDIHGHDDWEDLPSPLFMALLGLAGVIVVGWIICEVIL